MKQQTGIQKTSVIFLISSAILLVLLILWFFTIKDIITVKNENQPSKSNFPELVAKTEKGVFFIETKNSYGEVTNKGTGFFINPYGIGISCYHLLETGGEWTIKTTENKVFEIEEIIEKNTIHDYAIFKVKNPDSLLFPFIKIADQTPKKGEDIFVTGNPRGIESTVSKGIVSALRGRNDMLNGDSYIQIDASISEGSSGSPVMNMDGEVVGVVTLKITECENCNFAVNIKLLKNALRNIKIP